MNERIKSSDKLVAKGIAALSKVCVDNRMIGNFVVGEEPRLWRVSRTPAAEVTTWIDTPGYRGSGRRPATYTRVIQMETDAAVLQEQAERDWPDVVPAVAFTVGSAIVMADLSVKEINENVEFAERSQGIRPQTVAVAMGVGRSMLRSTIGVRSLSEDTFTQVEAPITVSDPLQLPYGQRRDVSIIEQQFPNAHLF